MELYNGKYCISHAELTDGIMSVSLIKKWVMEGRIEQARRGCRGSEALYVADSLPTKYRIEVMRRYPDLQAQAEYKEFADSIITDTAAEAFYAEYKIDGVRGLSYEKQAEYTNNATILAAFHDLLQRCVSMRGKLGKRVNIGGFWEARAKMLPRIADRFPNTLPENPRRLREKHDEFYRGGTPNYEVLISRKFQNSNAAKVASEEQRAMIMRLMCDHRNLDNEQVAMLYNVVAEKLGWQPITASAIKLWRERYDLETAGGRLGSKEFYNQRSMQNRRSAPTAPLNMWSLDGWDVELYYQKTTTKGGKSVTTYNNRLTVVVVLDPFNKYPVGYAIGERECAELITEAMRNAANHTAELFGQRYRAHQIQSDHYAMKAMTPIYSVSGDKVTPARVGNAKAKPIERYFLTLNKTYCQLMPNWSGFGITSNKNLQPNSDALNMLRKSFPDEAGCRKQIETIIAMERAKKLDKFVAAWQGVPEDHRLPMSDEQYLLTFGAETGHKNALEGSGLNVKLLGKRHTYDCFDVNFRRYSHIRWNVKYDPNDTSRVLAVSDNGELRFMLEEKYVQPMALVDRQEGDAEELARVRAFNIQELEPAVVKAIGAAQERVELLFHQNPQLDNTLCRHLICDSRGQHKDRRNERRLAAPIEDAEMAEVEPMITGHKPSTFDLY